VIPSVKKGEFIARILALSLIWSVLHAGDAQAQATETIQVPGLDQPVEILIDAWGVPHIYAETEHDLFFAQGYNAARDRLFQLEIWRRQATGTAAEVLGPREVDRDRAARLFRFRGDMDAEMRHYHERGHEIIPAFVAGINAYVDLVRGNPELLPLEFRLLGMEPGHWTPEVVVSRHQGLLGNAGAQLTTGRAVHLLGAEKVHRMEYFHPHPERPEIELDPAVDGDHLLEHDVLRLYSLWRSPMRFQPEDIVPDERADAASHQRLAQVLDEESSLLERMEMENLGSNNWVVSGTRAQDDYPLMVNDPHRAQQAPALRYWAHLHGPGWNVVGGGEPAIPGISIGHNGQGAWGLTIFRMDHEELYVYETHPDDPSQYRYQDGWESMEIVWDTIQVEGADPVEVELRFTRHGPVVYEDPEAGIAYGVAAAWREVGGAPYLASLRMNQSQSWEEFREAVTYNHIPAENMIWADRDGNIGWQPGGIAPIRRNFSGLVPVPGDGRYEWDGFLPIEELPYVLNPSEGYFGTANANLTSPFDYPYLDEAIYYRWADPYRQARVREVLDSGPRFNLMDMVELQHDYLSIPARTLVPLLRHVEVVDSRVGQARSRLLDWGFHLDPGSVEAGIYVEWERRLLDRAQDLFIPQEGQAYLSVGLKRLVDFLLAPPGEFGRLDEDLTPTQGRDRFLAETLGQAVEVLTERLGDDMEGWHYGQEEYKHALIRHPLSAAVRDELRNRLDVGPAPRGGYSFTVGNTGYGNNQTSGASFRIFVDTRDWDSTLGMSTPGQAGDPDSPFYDNLFQLWATDQVFPVLYTRERVEDVTAQRLQLVPGGP
jgi:penicillin G amidase